MSLAGTVVIGAGVSGLSAAHRIRELAPGEPVLVLEGERRAGGWLGTVERDGFVIEQGADSILAESPGFFALVDRLDIRDRVVRTRSDRHGAYVLREGRLERIPDGWSLLGPASLEPLKFSRVLSLAGRLRVLGDLVLPRGGEARESLAQFARRRLGWEALERLGQPLASGIYGSDAEALALSVTLPRFAALEAAHGSVMRGLMHERLEKARSGSPDGASGARYGLFCAFDRGMQVLIDALSHPLGERLCLGERAVGLRPVGGGYEVTTDARRLRASRVVVAVQGPAAASLLSPVDEHVAGELRRVAHASAATVTFAFDRSAITHPLDAYGLVVPAVERRRILAMTFASEKWPNRAPRGKALIRVFVAGPGEGHERGGQRAELDARSDEALTRTALRELRTLLGVTGEPLFSIVSRFALGMPRYGPAHAEIRASVHRALAAHPGLVLASNALDGVGIPHAIKSGERAAESLFSTAQPAAEALSA